MKTSAPSPPPNEARQVRVFISSTFRDMHAERDHLVTVVFPELRERLGLEFFDVDLRWGVPAKDADGETANSWEYCRQWIDRVEPFFVCMLGQRYGWEPEPGQLKAEEDRQRQQEERRSITDMEIRHAVLTTRLKRRSYFYLRAREAPATATEFVDPPPLLEKLESLKAEVRTCGRPVWDYPCEWTGTGFTGMEEFGRRVLEDLWSGVLRDERYVGKEAWRQVLGTDPDNDPRYADEAIPVPHELWEKIVAQAKPPPKDPLDAEREQMDAFAASRLRWFQGRTEELETLAGFIGSTGPDDARLAVVAAVPGQGKSALIAKLSESLSSDHCSLITAHSPLLITHFVGATERSASAHALVGRLLAELDRSGIVWPVDEQKEGEEPKQDFNSQCLRLAKRLGDFAGERRIVLLLDALNQLSDGHDLNWLPHRLGPGVRVVVSSVDDPAAKEDGPENKVLHALASRRPSPLRVPLGPLTEEDVRVIVVAYLREYCKELDTPHVVTICATPQARNPLYLLVVLGELRTLGGKEMNEVVPKLLASMVTDYPDTVALFRWVLQRLEVFNEKAPDAVQWWCLYLAHGRVGMASHELADLLARKLGADTAATALLIERGLRRYLLRRGGQLDFFHGQLRQAVMEQYGTQSFTTKLHGDIVDYFRDLADPAKDQSWKGEVARPFLHLVFHLVAARRFDELCETLCDLHFIEARCRVGQVFELIDDYQLTEARSSGVADVSQQNHLKSTKFERLHDYIEFTQRRAHVLKVYPYLTYQEAANQPDHTAPARDAQSRHMSGGETRPWLRWTNKPQIVSRCLLNLVGHSDCIHACAFSPNGEIILSASSDHTLKLWNARTGHEIITLVGHGGPVWSCVFSQDGTRIVSASSDTTLKIWDPVTGCALLTLEGHAERVTKCAFSPDGTIILSGSDDESVKLWDAVTGKELATLPAADGWVEFAGFTPDGRWIVTLGIRSTYGDGEVKVWDAARRIISRTISVSGLTHHNPCALSPDGSLLIWKYDGNNSELLEIWDLSSGALKHTVFRFFGSRSFSISGNGERCLHGCNNEVWVQDMRTGKLLFELGYHRDKVNASAFSPCETRGISASDDNTLKVWDLSAISNIGERKSYRSGILSCAYSANGARIATGGYAQIRTWNGDTGEELMVWDDNSGEVDCCCFSPDGSKVISASHFWLQVWDSRNGALLGRLDDHGVDVNVCTMSPGGSYILSAASDGTIRTWDAVTFAQTRVVSDSEDNAGTIARFLPDGSAFVTDSKFGWLSLLESESGQDKILLFAELDDGSSSNGISSICDVSPDGGSIGVVGTSGFRDFVALLDVETGKQFFCISDNIGEITACGFSPDSQYLAIGTRQGGLLLWDTRHQCELCRYLIDVAITALAWRPDGHALCLCGESGDIQILEPKNISICPPIVSAWQDPSNGERAVGCPLCRKWVEVPESALGMEYPCPNCGKTIKLNLFTINADWRPIAEMWIRPDLPLLLEAREDYPDSALPMTRPKEHVLWPIMSIVFGVIILFGGVYLLFAWNFGWVLGAPLVLLGLFWLKHIFVSHILIWLVEAQLKMEARND